MALEFGNRIAVNTSTTGTGTVTLGSAVSDAFMTFAEGGITNGATVHYLITDGTDFEIGTGTYTSPGTTLSRDTVIDSKISGIAGTSKMNLGGSAEVRVIDVASAIADRASLSDENQALTGGATVTSKSLGTQSSGTLTLDMGDRPLQHYTNNGAHTLAPGSVNGSCLVDITNGASAGAITTSGWTQVAGDDFDTTNANKFRCHCSVGNAGSLLIVQAMQ